MKFDNPEEALLWFKYKFWEKGISPAEFRRSYIKDVKDVIEIDNTISSKIEHERKVQEMVEKMKSKW